MTEIIDRILENAQYAIRVAPVEINVNSLQALIDELARLRIENQELEVHRYRLEDWLATIQDSTASPEIQFYCRQALSGEFIDSLNDPEDTGEADDQEATDAPLK